MKCVYRFVVDFARPSKSNTLIVMKNDDMSRVCRFVLMFNGKAFEMEGINQIILKAVKSDGKVILDADNVELLQDDQGNVLNEIEYALPATITDATGKVTMTVTFLAAGGEAITSFEFYAIVRNELYNEDDYVSEEDTAGFRDLLTRAQAAIDAVEGMIKKETLPNPYPLQLRIGNNDYTYDGKALVRIALHEMPFLGESKEGKEISWP